MPSHESTQLVLAAEEPGLFAVLGTSLTEFRAAVEGEDGRKVESMGADNGILPEIVRGTIEGIAEILRWLHRITEDIEDLVIAGDGAVALFEVGADTVIALGDGLDIGPIAENAGISTSAIDNINSSIQAVQNAIEIAKKIVGSILPPVEDITKIRSELVLLLGKRNALPAEQQGSLTQLMQRIGI